MQTTSNPRLIVGTFKRELKNRFLCEVSICNVDVVCYVPSSCHLSNFLQLEGKQVLLVPTQTPKSRTKYALYAIPYKRNYIMLNTSIANRAMENCIQGRRFSFLGKRKNVIKEYTVDGYKADLFLPASNTIFEIKSIISLKSDADFPTVYSERTLNQLKSIQELLKKGYKVCFAIVSLHPYVKEIKLNHDTRFFEELQKCLKLGLLLKAYTCRLRDDVIVIDKEIDVNY